jgi:hypothetical protein
VMISWEFETPLYRVIQEDRSMFWGVIVSVIEWNKEISYECVFWSWMVTETAPFESKNTNTLWTVIKKEKLIS